MALMSYGILREFLRDMCPKLEYHNVVRLKFLSIESHLESNSNELGKQY